MPHDVYRWAIDVLALGSGMVIILAGAAVLWKCLRCAHAWELVDKTEIEAPIETMAKSGFQSAAYWPSDLAKLASKRIVLAMRCPRCGKAKIWESAP